MAILIETGGQAGCGDDGLRGSRDTRFEQPASGIVMLRRRRDHLVVEQSKSLQVRGPAIELPERPTAVIGWKPSRNSQSRGHRKNALQNVKEQNNMENLLVRDQNNDAPRSSHAEWDVTRRHFLKASGLFIAGVSASMSPLRAAESRDTTKVSFGVVTDAHYADRPGTGRVYNESLAKMGECVRLMNDKNVDFLIELGDFKDQDQPPAEKSTLEYLTAIEKVFSQFNGPRYHVLGNHDLDSISKQQCLGRVDTTGIVNDITYYSYDSNGIHFVVLDACFTKEGEPYDHGNFGWTDTWIPAQELEWLQRDLASTSKPVIAFVHQLLCGRGNVNVNNADEVRHVLQKGENVLAVFQGHHHHGRYNRIEGIHYYTLKAMVEGGGEKNNAYAIVNVHADNSLNVTGYRRAVSKTLEA